MSFPAATPSYDASSTSQTLNEFNHLTRHTDMQTDLIGLSGKVGTGVSTPTAGKVLRANGTGTSVWGATVLTTDVTGTLPVDNGGSGTTTLTFPAGTDTLVSRNSTDTLTNKTLTSPILTTPALGTPSALVLTNATGTPAGLVLTNATGKPTSIDLGNATNLGNASLTTTVGDLGGVWAATTCTVTVSGGTAPSYSTNFIRTTVIGKTVIATWLLSNTSGGTAGAGTEPLFVSLPHNSYSGTRIGHGSVYNGGTAIVGASTVVNVELVGSANGSTAYLTCDGNNILGNNQNNANRYIYLTATYEMA